MGENGADWGHIALSAAIAFVCLMIVSKPLERWAERRLPQNVSQVKMGVFFLFLLVFGEIIKWVEKMS